MEKQNFCWPVKTMGVDYYPEQWSESLWEEDLDRMKDAGTRCVRIAEFGWNMVEPEEGQFTFDFYDRFLDLCEKKGMKVIFGTPSATPPAWLTEKYPEVLNASMEGVLYRHGSRRHYNYNSPKYRELVSRIVEKEAQHYGPHPALTGWQIDNELNCETADFYSEADNAAFREFLKKKYGSLEELNQAWGTAFWNQTYTSWEQVHVIRPTVSGAVNPHQHLDYLRFISASCIGFAAMQADIIRQYTKPGDFITTNGLFQHLDNHRLEKDVLDVYTFDSYPNFAREAVSANGKTGMSFPLRDRYWSNSLSKVRSICPHFGIMEQQAGPGGSTVRLVQAAPHPGQLGLWAMQSVAHGADYISFFRWRTALYGSEIYWHGILDYDNRDNRRLAEVKEFYKNLRTLDAAAGADYKASFGVLCDIDNTMDAEVDNWHGRIEAPSLAEIFTASQLNHTPFNYVNLTDETSVSELSPYPVLIYPHPVLMNGERARVLMEYVEEGGTLIVGCRAGLKDMEGHMEMRTQPCRLMDMTGTAVSEFSFACEGEEPIKLTIDKQTAGDRTVDGGVFEAPVFNDALDPLEEYGTKVLARYENGSFAGKAALTEHVCGKGRVLHLGTTFTQDITRFLLDYTGVLEPFADAIKVPEEAEVALQEKNGRRFYFVLNYAAHEISVNLKKPATSMYDGAVVKGRVKIPAYGTAVYEISE